MSIWKWKIQYGVQVAVDDVSRSALPKIFLNDSSGMPDAEVGTGEGTFWFDPGASISVLSQANTGTGLQAEILGLNGWVNGDGYYFASAIFFPASFALFIKVNPAKQHIK